MNRKIAILMLLALSTLLSFAGCTPHEEPPPKPAGSSASGTTGAGASNTAPRQKTAERMRNEASDN